MSKLNLNNLRENVFFIVLIIYIVFLPFSEAFVSISAGLLLFQALVLTSWRHPSVKNENWGSLIMILSIFLVYVAGMIKTEDTTFAFYELRKVSFWVVLPFAFFCSPRLSSKRFHIVLILFTLAVFAASIVAFVRLLFKDSFHIDGFRQITIISHIRYSFQLVLSIIIVAWFLFSKSKILLPVNFNKGTMVFLLVWLIGFLFVLKSITGIFAFLGTLSIFLVILIFRIKNHFRRGLTISVLLVLLIFPVIYIVNVWNDFYDTETIDPHKVDKYTASGNPYYFDFSATEKENGNWVNVYINKKELRKEWNKLSEAKFDSIDENGYSYQSTLIRYLTSKGLRKDSAGIRQLTETDIAAIENGIANHIYVDHGFSVYPRVYETIWELDRYINSGNPNYQSFSQRIEFVKASLFLIKKNMWLGIGTGNWKIKYAQAYDEMNSKLKPENQGPSHNQYLNYMVKFGIIGFIYIFSMLIIPVFREGHRRNLIYWLFLISMAIANFSDANFETHMGLSFFCFFYCLFLWHSTDELKSFRV